jgi:hypothetical protein
VSTDSPHATPDPGIGRLGRVVVGLPSRLPVLFFWVVLVVAVAVLLEVFTVWVVLPATAVLAGLAWRAVADPVPLDRASVRGAGWALGISALWFAANAWFAGEVLLVQRDPGFLTLEGLWLSAHADPDIPLRSAAEVAARIPELSVVSDAFWRSGDHIYAQGAKAFPGLIAMAGWLAGQPGVLAANLVIGALALLAVYDVGRRLIGPHWGLLPMAALALTTPMIYFSRTPFTEPTNIVLTFGGLAVLWGAFRTPRLWPIALGSSMVGASALARIDGAAVSAGLILALGLVAAGTRDRSLRRHRARGFLVGSGAAGLMVLLGYLDVRVHSAAYLADHAWLYRPLVALLVACFVAAGAAVAVTGWAALPAWAARNARVLGTVAAAGVLVVCAGLAIRPLLWQENRVVRGSAQEWFVAAFQRAAGVAVDGTRSYDEMTVVWLFWYLGPATLVLAAVGAALLARRGVGLRRPELVALLVVLGVPSLLYLVRPSITPDQIWAMRRFLPAVLPGALLFAGWLAARLVTAARGPWWRAGAWGVVGLVLLAPPATWGTLVLTPEYTGRVDQVGQLCALTEGRKVVVVRATDPPLLPTLRIMCDADVVELPAPASPQQLADIREAWGDEVLVVAMSADAVPGLPASAPTLATPMARWPHSLYPSLSPVRFTSTIWVAEVAPDGSVVPVAPLASTPAAHLAP